MCDQEFAYMDTTVAVLSTIFAFVMFIPCIHIILKTFIPGLPDDISFEELEYRSGPLDWIKMKFNPKYKRRDTIQNLELTGFGGGEKKLSERFGKLSSKQLELSRISESEKLEFEIARNRFFFTIFSFL